MRFENKNYVLFFNKESFENRENQLRVLFQGVQKDIKKHIDTMKNQLEELQTSLFEACEQLKIHKVSTKIKRIDTNNLQKKLVRKEKHYKKQLKVKINSEIITLAKVAERMRADKFIKESQKALDKNEANLEKLKKNMHASEYNLKKLKKAHSTYAKAMGSLVFKPNTDWIPVPEDVGFVGENVDTRKAIRELEELLEKEEDNKIRQKFRQKTELNEVNLKFKPYAIVELKNGDLAVTAFDKHKLIVVKCDTYKHVKEITGADNIPLRYPSGICCDDQKDNVYLCDQYNNRILVFDSTVDSLVNIIQEDLINPIDICFNSNSLYVLDYGNKLVKCFDLTGKLNKQFSLNDRSNEILNTPRHQAISNDEIAVTDNFDKIYIYDKNTSHLVQVIDADLDSRFMSVYYFDDYLFIHEIKTKDDSVINNFLCYEKFESLDLSSSNIRLNWKESYQRELEILKDSVSRSYNIAKVGDKFAVCLHEKKKIILI